MADCRVISMPDLPETYFVALDYELPSRPGLTFQETPAGFTLKDVFTCTMSDTMGKVRRIYRAKDGEWKDCTKVVINTLLMGNYLSAVEREFLEFHGYESTQNAAE